MEREAPAKRPTTVQRAPLDLSPHLKAQKWVCAICAMGRRQEKGAAWCFWHSHGARPSRACPGEWGALPSLGGRGGPGSSHTPSPEPCQERQLLKASVISGETPLPYTMPCILPKEKYIKILVKQTKKHPAWPALLALEMEHS